MLIWLAYFAIPVVLASFAWPRRRSLPYRAVLWLFAAFILGCGLTHLLEAVTFYRPVYRLSGLIKLATALVSWATVIALVPVARRVAGLEWSGHPMPPRSAGVERRHPWRNPYAVAVLAVVLATIARLGLSPLLGQQSPFLTYFMAVMAVAGYGGFGPSLLAVLLGGASAWYLFLGTPGSWDVGGVEGTLGLGLYLFVGATTGLMAESLRAARRRAEANTLELLEQRRALEDEVARREQAQADLKMLNTTLEERVAERTAQLEGRARELADLNERLQQEVGERQQVEGRLRDANRELDRVSSRLHGIMEGTPDLIAALDPDFRFLDFNRAYRDEFEKIFGSRIEAGTSLVEALAHLPGEQASAVEIWSRALRGESFIVTREFGDERRERKWYEIVYSPIRDEAGQLIGAAHVVRDVTDRQRAEAAVAASQALFEASSSRPRTRSPSWTRRAASCG